MQINLSILLRRRVHRPAQQNPVTRVALSLQVLDFEADLRGRQALVVQVDDLALVSKVQTIRAPAFLD